MATIYQMNLFSWKDVEDLGDLERLKTVLETMPDSKLMHKLINERGKGRNDYPVKAIWNSILAGIVFQHSSIEQLRRELKRNAQLREICGFDLAGGSSKVPSSMAYNRFLLKLIHNQEMIDEIFNELVKELKEEIPNLGKNLAFDGKAISSLSPGKKKICDDQSPDLRREKDADWGKKKYKGVDEKGNLWEKAKSWFGFRLHLIVDADYEVPIAYQVTKASTGEQPVMRELFTELEENHPELIQTCDHAMGDKGYDGLETISMLWDQYRIKPVIDIRNTWKDGEPTRMLESKFVENLTYDFKGTVYCHCPSTGEVRRMTYGGFEEKRQSLKYLCPAIQYGIECKGAATCPLRKGIRVPLKENPRIFTPVPRSSHKWQRLYNKRTSVERVNSRLDVSFGFERHYIRGLAKMKMRCGLALCTMLALALGRAREDRQDLMRSLVKTA